jgi:hypothetical protein
MNTEAIVSLTIFGNVTRTSCDQEQPPQRPGHDYWQDSPIFQLVYIPSRRITRIDRGRKDNDGPVHGNAECSTEYDSPPWATQALAD